MNNKELLKIGLDLVVSVGTSIALGGLGAVGLAAKTGVAAIVGKYTVPLASAVYANMLSEQACKYVNDKVDSYDKILNTFTGKDSATKA